MTLQLQDILGLAQATLNNPRQGMRQVLSMNPSMNARLMALALMAVVSALLSQVSAGLMPVEGNPVFDLLLASPVQTALIQGAGMVLTAAMVHLIGRVFGGTGQFDEALLAVVWLQVFLVVLQAGQLLAMLILPPAAVMIGILSMAVFPWLLTMFVTEVHRFNAPFKVFLGILLSALGLAFVLSFLMVALMGAESFGTV